MHWRLLCFFTGTLSLFPVLASTLIAGGRTVAVSEEIAKTQVLIQTYDKARSLYICSGTVISENLVLTARHCFDDMVSAEVVFTTNRFKANKSQVRQGIDLFPDPSGSADIVIMKFKGTLPKEYKAALIGETGIKLRLGLPVTATGYAATKTNGTDDGILRKIDSKVLYFDDSIIHLPGPKSRTTPLDYAGLIEGDSGGAMFAQDAQGKLRVIGVHSGANYKYAYTGSLRLKSFLPWIKETISEN